MNFERLWGKIHLKQYTIKSVTVEAIYYLSASKQILSLFLTGMCSCVLFHLGRHVEVCISRHRNELKLWRITRVFFSSNGQWEAWTSLQMIWNLAAGNPSRGNLIKYQNGMWANLLHHCAFWMCHHSPRFLQEHVLFLCITLSSCSSKLKDGPPNMDLNPLQMHIGIFPKMCWCLCSAASRSM